MIIWINGSFGSGKTTLSEVLLNKIPNSIIFDPEKIGFLIHKIVPESRSEDFQNFPMWRKHVVLFAIHLVHDFGKNLIIPMTLVNPDYISEIHGSIKKDIPNFYHFFLQVNETTLRRRITDQVMNQHDLKTDNEIREWRLAQVNRCLAAIPHLPKDTVFLDSGKQSPNELADIVLRSIGI